MGSNIAVQSERPSTTSINFHGFALPAELKRFATGFERSRAMLDLADDWDGEGSPGYAESTWRAAAGIAITSANSFLSRHDDAPPTPTIAKGPDGSVDVLWQSGNKKLMINVPVGDEPVSYHGYDRENPRREIKGLLDPTDSNEWMLTWLTE